MRHSNGPGSGRDGAASRRCGRSGYEASRGYGSAHTGFDRPPGRTRSQGVIFRPRLDVRDESPTLNSPLEIATMRRKRRRNLNAGPPWLIKLLIAVALLLLIVVAVFVLTGRG
jgi:hypothetical protein